MRNLTAAQQAAVEHRGSTLLVSAAAGSGKTMVLVERLLRMLREGATTIFEGWGKDEKWNTSLFHLTMSYAALFMTDF